MALLPKVKFKSQVIFPANVYGRTGIDVAKQNGNFYLDLDYEEFATISAFPDALEPTTFLTAWEASTNTFEKISVTNIKADITAGFGSVYQPLDVELTALAGTTSAADKLPYFTGPGAAAVADFTPFARTLVDDTTQAAMRTTLALTPGTDIQALDADLTALAALNGTGIARRTAANTWSVGTAVTSAELATMPAYTFKGNNSGGAATPIDVDIAGLTTKASPAGTDYVMLSDQAAGGAWKKAAVSSIGAAGAVASYEGRSGAVLALPADRINLGAVGVIRVQKFTASGTYTPNANMLYCIIECAGGGGGGTNGTAGTINWSSGGGGGNTSRRTVAAATIGASQTVTIDAGGAGGAVANGTGGSGGDSSVGALCIGKGASGGQGGSNATAGGAGGVTGTGDISPPGQPGGGGGIYTSTNFNIPSGSGGNASLGFGSGAAGVAGFGAITGNAGGLYGGGGSGGLSSNPATGAAGGPGANGIVIIT